MHGAGAPPNYVSIVLNVATRQLKAQIGLSDLWRGFGLRRRAFGKKASCVPDLVSIAERQIAQLIISVLPIWANIA